MDQISFLLLTVLPEEITMQCEAFRWPEQQTLILDFYQAFDSSNCMNRLRDFFSAPLDKDYLLAAENICNHGLYSIPPYGLIQFQSMIDWQGDSSTKRGFSRLLHAHFFIKNLIEAFKYTNNSLYLSKGYEIIEDWIVKNTFRNAINPMAWHDETTARRLITWIAFFDEARKILTQEKLAFLFSHIKKHAELLGTDKFYSKNTNHGMFQDQALIVYSDYFSFLEGSKELKLLACSRLKEYFDVIFSKEGVHLEHSPYYHSLIANKLLSYSHYFQDLDDSFGDYLIEKYYRAAAFATYIIKPDGLLPQIGDTQSIKPGNQLWKDNPVYQYAKTQGRKGQPPEENDIVFPEAGYAIFRDSWAKKELSTYVMFTAAYHTNYHKHSDDLSLWIYARGSDILVESGPDGYNKDEFSNYCYSSFAHNVLIVDHKGLPRTDGKYFATKIVDYLLTPDKPIVTGITERYKGIKHTRVIEYDKLNQIITVSDNISSSDEHTYQLLWHLAPKIEAIIDGKDHITLKKENTCIMNIEVKGDQELSISKVKGQLEPFMLGWYFRKFEEKEPIYTLVFECQGKDVNICTDFILSSP